MPHGDRIEVDIPHRVGSPAVWRLLDKAEGLVVGPWVSTFGYGAFSLDVQGIASARVVLYATNRPDPTDDNAANVVLRTTHDLFTGAWGVGPALFIRAVVEEYGQPGVPIDVLLHGSPG